MSTISSDCPFQINDLVETTKGAKFWGRVVSCYMIHKDYEVIGTPGVLLDGPTEWRVDVQAIAPDFLGTIHVYPAKQLSLRESHPIEDGEGWQDISTAPKDGRKVILFDPNRYGREMCIRSWRRGESNGRPVDAWWDEYAQWSPSFKPTLWLPYPAAPSNPGTSKVENSRST